MNESNRGTSINDDVYELLSFPFIFSFFLPFSSYKNIHIFIIIIISTSICKSSQSRVSKYLFILMTTHTTAKISRGLRVLPSKKAQTVNEENSKLQKDIASIEQWWSEPRWKYTKREYSGML